MPLTGLIRGTNRTIAAASLRIDAQPIRLAMLAAIVPCVGQDAHLEHGDGLHFLVGVGKTAMFEVEIAGLLDEALQFHRTAPIAVLFPQGGQSGLDRSAVLACWFLLRLRLDHARFEKGKQRANCFLRSAFPRKIRPACSASQRHCRSPSASLEPTIAVTCLYACLVT